jgi:hypothetical protein
MRRLIVKVGEVVSTDPGTHGKKIGLYVLAGYEEDDSYRALSADFDTPGGM